MIFLGSILFSLKKQLSNPKLKPVEVTPMESQSVQMSPSLFSLFIYLKARALPSPPPHHNTLKSFDVRFMINNKNKSSR